MRARELQHFSRMVVAHDKLCEMSIRIKELSDKSILILIFLSVGFAVWGLLEATPVPSPAHLHWWICAVYPVIPGSCF